MLLYMRSDFYKQLEYSEGDNSDLS
jgi:hypothetical protein